MQKTIAIEFVAYCYDTWSGDYARPRRSEIETNFGGELISSSNDLAGNSGWSFSPDDVWEFPDGSRAEVSYSYAATI